MTVVGVVVVVVVVVVVDLSLRTRVLFILHYKKVLAGKKAMVFTTKCTIKHTNTHTHSNNFAVAIIAS